MKKQSLALIVCLSLIMLGNGALKNSNAQTGISHNPAVKGKKSSAEKRAAVRQIVRRQISAYGTVAGEGDPCDESVPITLGQTLSGALSANDCQLPDDTFIDFYSFQGTAGQTVSISLNSGAFDTYLFLMDADGNVIEENDDGGSSTNSRIPDFGGAIALPTTGTYLIGANSFDPLETGAYTVSLNSSPACQTTPLAFGQNVSGALTGTDCIINVAGEFFFKDFYTFQGTAGQQISIAMNSDAVNSFLILHTPSGSGRLENNDGGGGVNARIPAGSGTVTLNQTGTYTIEAGTFESGETGAYTLILSDSTSPGPAPAQFDFDGDGKTDISIFRPSSGEWWINRSSTSQTVAAQFGQSTDKLVPADFTGDGKSDLAFWRGSTGEWFILRSEDASFLSFPFGTGGDTAVVGDFDADGRADPTIYRPSTNQWFILKSSGGTIITTFGTAGDVPVVADYDGDGKSDIAIFRPSVGQWWIAKSGDSTVVATAFGTSTDKPVQGDYTGDGRADIAVFRPSTGEWLVLRSEDGSFFSVPFGTNGDLPAPGDYDGDGRFDTAVFRPLTANWFVNRTTAGILITSFGVTGDRPIPNSFVP